MRRLFVSIAIGSAVLIVSAIILLGLFYTYVLPARLEASHAKGRIIDSLPCTRDVDGMSVTLASAQIYDFRFVSRPYDYCTSFAYSVEPGLDRSVYWRLKRVKCWGYQGEPIESTCSTYNFPDFDLAVDQALWPSNGPYDLELGFRESTGCDALDKQVVAVPGPNKSLSLSCDFTAFGATLHMIGAFGAGAPIPGTSKTAKSPCLALSIQGNPKVVFTILTFKANFQPMVEQNEADFQGQQTCIQFPLTQDSNVWIEAIGPDERIVHFFVKVPAKVEPMLFHSIN